MPSLQDSRVALRPNSKITLSPIVAELIRPRWWIAQHSIVAGKHLPMNIEELQVSRAKTKDRHCFVDQRLFCGMFCLLGTIDASAVREMNL